MASKSSVPPQSSSYVDTSPSGKANVSHASRSFDNKSQTSLPDTTVLPTIPSMHMMEGDALYRFTKPLIPDSQYDDFVRTYYKTKKSSERARIKFEIDHLGSMGITATSEWLVHGGRPYDPQAMTHAKFNNRNKYTPKTVSLTDPAVIADQTKKAAKRLPNKKK